MNSNLQIQTFKPTAQHSGGAKSIVFVGRTKGGNRIYGQVICDHFIIPCLPRESQKKIIQINDKCGLKGVSEATLESCMSAVTKN